MLKQPALSLEGAMAHLPERTMLIGGAGGEPPEGSREWFLLTRDRLKSEMQTLRSTRQFVQRMFDQMEASGAWKLLTDPQSKRPFRSFDAFCLSRTGFGWSAKTIQQRIASMVRPVEEGGVAALRNEKGGRPRKDENISIGKVVHSGGGNSAAYLIGRLKRDAPEYAERLASGEFRSARAAAIAAGIIKPPPTPFQAVLKLLRKLTAAERRKLLGMLRNDP